MARVSIGVFGAGGRMGRAVTRSIRDDYAGDAQVVAEISSDVGRREDLLATDAIIDVSLPAGTERLLDWLNDVEQPPVVVSATTGLSATQFERLTQLGSRTTVLHSANFAPGVALLRQMLLSVAPALEQLGYQAVLTDTHHKEKRDAPSGTAKDVRLPMTQAISQAGAKAGLPENVIELLPKLAVRKDMPAEQKAPGDDLVRGWTRSPASEAQGERAKQIDWGNFRKGLGGCDNEGELIFCAYEYLAEPFLPEDYRSANGSLSVPVFIIDYPAEVSPLARRKDANRALTDRFELFVDGREICNAFSELNDPDDQKARFEEQVDKKSRGADETMDYDADYIRALEHGMPPAAGFGLGVDRLTMLLACQASIRDVIAFPLLRPEAR